jgi:hypothetical protein
MLPMNTGPPLSPDAASGRAALAFLLYPENRFPSGCETGDFVIMIGSSQVRGSRIVCHRHKSLPRFGERDILILA